METLQRLSSNTQAGKITIILGLTLLWGVKSVPGMAARRWKIIFPAGRESRKLDSLDRRISRSMESVETIVSNLASLGAGETGRLSASTTALEQEVSLPRQLARSSLFQSRRGDKWGEAGRPRPGEEMVRSIGGGWHEYRNLNGRSFTIPSRISNVILKSAQATGSSTTTVRQTKLVGSLLVESKTAKLWPQVTWNQ